MPDVNERLRKAIQAARAGKELSARDLFLDVTKLDPNNKLAWLWLIGLLDDLDDRIDACQRVLAIDPADRDVPGVLAGLLEERRGRLEQEQARAGKSLDEIAQFVRNGETETALMLLRQAVRDHDHMERAWQMLADHSPDLEERTRALSRVMDIDPTNLAADRQLKYLQALQNDPYDLARYYEERGEADKALDTYKRIALSCKTKEEWDRVYVNIIRLERLQVEQIRHVSPTLSLARLTAGPVVLHFLGLLTHYGMQPQFAPLRMWIAFLVCVAGSFFVALAALRLHHPIWGLFGEEGTSGSRLSRAALGTAGVILVVVSFAPLLSDSMGRLVDYMFFLL